MWFVRRPYQQSIACLFINSACNMWQALPFDTAAGRQDRPHASQPPSAACHLLCRLIVQPLILDTQLIVQLTGTGPTSCDLRPTTHDLGGLFQAQLGSMSPDSKDTLGFALISLESSQNIMMPLLVCGCLLLLLPLLLLLLLLFLFVWES